MVSAKSVPAALPVLLAAVMTGVAATGTTATTNGMTDAEPGSLLNTFDGRQRSDSRPGPSGGQRQGNRASATTPFAIAAKSQSRKASTAAATARRIEKVGYKPPGRDAAEAGIIRPGDMKGLGGRASFDGGLDGDKTSATTLALAATHCPRVRRGEFGCLWHERSGLHCGERGPANPHGPGCCDYRPDKEAPSRSLLVETPAGEAESTPCSPPLEFHRAKMPSHPTHNSYRSERRGAAGA